MTVLPNRKKRVTVRGVLSAPADSTKLPKTQVRASRSRVGELLTGDHSAAPLLNSEDSAKSICQYTLGIIISRRAYSSGMILYVRRTDYFATWRNLADRLLRRRGDAVVRITSPRIFGGPGGRGSGEFEDFYWRTFRGIWAVRWKGTKSAVPVRETAARGMKRTVGLTSDKEENDEPVRFCPVFSVDSNAWPVLLPDPLGRHRDGPTEKTGFQLAPSEETSRNVG
ncbi:hypothetical protein H6P81_005252 [Aristolochia fimbriata]|uniref:Uncharacterized protein n=1 Tax=Aristolochia fimbriata TaxID=158543 RepID=A0AAV7EU34_ARIFI|nr:hypothetical protein H6P81_005252 [Aristolochia fimbriata]